MDCESTLFQRQWNVPFGGILGKREICIVLEAAVQTQGMIVWGWVICPCIERSRNKEISIESPSWLGIWDWLTGYTAFLVKLSIYRNMKFSLLTWHPMLEWPHLGLEIYFKTINKDIIHMRKIGLAFALKLALA